MNLTAYSSAQRDEMFRIANIQFGPCRITPLETGRAPADKVQITLSKQPSFCQGAKNRPIRPDCGRTTKGGDLGVESDWPFVKRSFYRGKKNRSFQPDGLRPTKGGEFGVEPI